MPCTYRVGNVGYLIHPSLAQSLERILTANRWSLVRDFLPVILSEHPDGLLHTSNGTFHTRQQEFGYGRDRNDHATGGLWLHG